MFLKKCFKSYGLNDARKKKRKCERGSCTIEMFVVSQKELNIILYYKRANTDRRYITR